MNTHQAKLFANGGSQAVRLPAEFRFADADAVYVRRDAVNGDVILSAKPPESDWASFFALRDHTDQTDEGADFMLERALNEPLTPIALFDDAA